MHGKLYNIALMKSEQLGPQIDKTRRPLWPYARKGLGVLGASMALAATCHASGVVVTKVFPSSETVVTNDGEVLGQLDAFLDFDANTGTVATTVGKVMLTSETKYPTLPLGATIHPMLDKGVLTTFTSQNEESRDKIAEAANEAAIELAKELALRYALGAAAALLLVSALRISILRRHEGVNETVGAALVLAILGTNGVATYANSSPPELHMEGSTGLIAEAQKYGDILTKLKEYEGPIGSYIAGLLHAIESIETPNSPEQQSAVKILFVSDIHSKPGIYKMLKQVVEENDITVVIDSGDLVEFGQPQELRDDMKEGIASLGVPYFFVKGNHDNDAEVRQLESLQKSTVPNLEILGKANQLTVMSYAGLVLAGAGDPRYYGDANDGVSAQEAAYGQAIRKTLKNNGVQPQTYDILVSHHPAVVNSLGEFSKLRANGHMHTPKQDIQPNNISLQIGTTGAGGLTHVSADPETGSNADFTIVSYDGACRAIKVEQFSANTNGKGSSYTSTNIPQTTPLSNYRCEKPSVDAKPLTIKIYPISENPSSAAVGTTYTRGQQR